MTAIDEHGRSEPPEAGNEIETLLGFLDYQRATLEWKTSGLDAEGLQTTLGPTTMTLGGLLKHMALVEDSWFSERLLGNPLASPRRDGGRPTLRWVLVHMIEEYARHNGHADLLRESVDGQTGE